MLANQASTSSPQPPPAPQQLRASPSSNSIDNRNRAFVPPTQISQLKRDGPTHDFSSGSNSTTDNTPQTPIYPPNLNTYTNGHGEPMNMGNQQHGNTLAKPRPPISGGTSGGTSRRTSFFSSFRKSPNTEAQQLQQQDLQQTQGNGNGMVQRPGPAQAHRPGSANGPVNEFGGMRASRYEGYAGTPASPMPHANGNGSATPPPPLPDKSPQQQQQQPNRQPQSQSAQQQPQPMSSQPTALHPEIRSVVQLTVAHARKVYFSGPLIRRLERGPDGGRPHKDEGWVDVWAQLGGTTLSIWDMAKIAEASKEGKEVPPTYINVQDAFVQVLGSVTVPETPTTPAKRYTDVLTLNTAGLNLLLFACPNTAALMSWAAALRLSAWEKSRLEEIYTAHLLRITIPNAKDAPSPLHHGRMEGWAQVRLAGQTDWKKLYICLSSGASNAVASQSSELARTSTADSSGGKGSGSAPSTPKTGRRISNLFSRDSTNGASSSSSTSGMNTGPLPARPIIELFSSAKPKDRRLAPVLTLRNVTQAFAMYPERPEMMQRSTLMKLEGVFGGESGAGGMKGREAWIMVMPEAPEGSGVGGAVGEMLRWAMCFHDAFELYGRPGSYTWDPRDPASQMFGYPVGPDKDMLFLEREAAEVMDPREDRTAAVRSKLLNIILDKMRAMPGFQPHNIQGQGQQSTLDGPPSLPPLSIDVSPHQQQQQAQTNGSAPQLPSFNFGSSEQQQRQRQQPQVRERAVLTPITERTLESVDFRGRQSMSSEKFSPQNSGDQQPASGSASGYAVLQSAPSTVAEVEEESSNAGQAGAYSVPATSTFGAAFTASPPPVAKSIMTDSSSLVSVSLKTGPNSNSHFGDAPHAQPSLPPKSPGLTSPAYSYRTSSPASSVRQSSIDNASVARATSPAQRSKSISGFSVLTSPHSAIGHEEGLVEEDEEEDAVPETSGSRAVRTPPPAERANTPVRLVASPVQISPPTSPNHSIMTSPYSPVGEETKFQGFDATNNNNTTSVPSSAVSQAPPSSAHTEISNSIFDEAGARYYMQQWENEEKQHHQPPEQRGGRIPTTISETDESSMGRSTPPVQPLQVRPRAPLSPAQSYTAPTRRSTPGTLERQVTDASLASSGLGVSPVVVTSQQRVGVVLGKPTGARVEHTNSQDFKLEKRDFEQDTSSASTPPATMSDPIARPGALTVQSGDDNADALAALSFLDQDEPSEKPVPTSASAAAAPMSPEPEEHAASGNFDGAAPYKSSFAPSKQAAERKARLQAQEEASHAAAHKPGRPNGKRKSVGPGTGGWNQSSDEEEEEDDDDDEDADSDDSPPPPRMQPASGPVPAAPAPIRPLQPRPRDSSPGGPPRPMSGGGGYSRPSGDAYPQTRQSRVLPQVPGARPGSEDFLNGGASRRIPTDGHPQELYQQPVYGNTPLQAPKPGVAQQNVWSQVLQPGQDPAALNNTGRDTFVQIEPPSQTMTKAFLPQGLLGAGLQDKHDRSAKKQEEIARETGSSLVNVPNKPPPPQTGLLGAVAAHERERKREGGVGAALTEREREKRFAEERQRKLDEFTRQQLEIAQGGGSMYQQPQFTGYNPMMANPMMMGMNPMMTGMMGYPGGMPGYANPQHMFAAQQAAAQAYQQAMIAFSVAGSQVGGEEGPQAGQTGAAAQPMNPMMTGMSMFDPRMSMMGMGMPMMGSPYAGAMGGQPGMQGMMPGMQQGMHGMQGGFPMQGGMGMGMQQMTGSGFDPRFSPAGDGLHPPGPFQGHSQIPSRNSSPAGQGSPAVRSTDSSGPRPSSGQSSPKPAPQ